MKKGAGSEEITLQGTLTKDWKLKLDHPISVYNLEIRKRFETAELDLINNDCKNCGENWIEAHLKFTGTLNEDSHDPLKAIFWIDHLEGKPQPLSGPIYNTGDFVRLKGRLFLMKCQQGEGPVVELLNPINLTRSGEFEGPQYGVKRVQLLGLDVRKGLVEGDVEITGIIGYRLNQGSPYESNLCLDGITINAEAITGAKNKEGSPLGTRKILFNSDREMFKSKDGTRDFRKIEDAAGKNGIYFHWGKKMDCAYQFFDGEKELTVPKSRQNNAYQTFKDFFGIK